MKLQKKLINFYKESKALENAKLQLKELKRSSIKLSKDKEINLSEIQDAIDHQLQIAATTETIGQLPGDLLSIQRKVLIMLKAIGFPAKKIITIDDKHYGKIGFWYEGNYLHFEEQREAFGA